MNVEHLLPQDASSTSDTNFEGEVRRYRQKRRRKARERAAHERHTTSSEADHIVGFARIWAPYGGAPDDEVFQRFGMARSRFIEKVWETIQDAGCDSRIADQLATVYPRTQVPPTEESETYG